MQIAGVAAILIMLMAAAAMVLKTLRTCAPINTTLTAFANAQEAYFARHGGYVMDAGAVPGFTPKSGVTVSIAGGDGGSVIAVAIQKSCGEIYIWDSALKIISLIGARPGPLVAAALGGDVQELASSLTQNGGDVNGALVAVAATGNADAARHLLKNGADANALNVRGAPVLQVAARFGRLKVMELLLSNGADANAPSETGTALIEAATEGRLDMVKLLLEHGADVDARGVRDMTALLAATKGGHNKIAQLLLAKGAQAELKTWDRQTPLIGAACKGMESVAAGLIELGVNVNAKNRYGQTPLICAAMNGHAGVVKLLLANGARTSSEDKKGRTAADLAKDYPEIVKLLAESSK